MAFVDDLIGISVSPEEATVLKFEEPVSAPARKVSTGLTAAGTTVADALQLTSFINVVSTAAASTGVKLPTTWPIGQIGHVQNNGANAMQLYIGSSLTINGTAGATGVSIAAAAGNLIIRNSATDFGAYVMAKES